MNKTSIATPVHLLRVLSATFDLPIYNRQISQWRGAFVEMAGIERDLLHNHNGDEGLYYRYPSIQYRQYKGNASIFAIEAGIQEIQEILIEKEWQLNWQGKARTLSIKGLKIHEYQLQMTDKMQSYKLYNWLPLNKKNYDKWMDCQDLKERIELLENILASQLIGFFKNIGWRLPKRLNISIQEMSQMKLVNCFEAQLLAFSIVYKTNVLLPPGIAIGKAVSHGFGWQMPERDYQN